MDREGSKRTLDRRASSRSKRRVAGVDVERHVQRAHAVRINMHQRLFHYPVPRRRHADNERQARWELPVDAELVDVVHGERQYAQRPDDALLALVKVSQRNVADRV